MEGLLPMSTCFLCQGSLDPRYDSIVVLPKDYIHTSCFYESGMTPEMLAGFQPCCKNKEIVLSLRGKIIEPSSKVPSDQFWLSLPADAMLHRFRMGVDSTGFFIRPVMGD